MTTYGEMVDRTRDAGFGPEPKRRIMLGTYALAAGYYDAFYGQAQKVRTLLIREHREALDGFDAIVTPTSPDRRLPDRRQGGRSARDVRVRPAHDPVLPRRAARASSIPCGLSEGLPVGLQLIGRQFGENGLFRVGHALEQAIGFDSGACRLGCAATSGSSRVPEREIWEPVIGLEIHVQLKTRTKMFCRCPVGFGAGENTQTCPVCLGFPGALPVMNRRAIEWTIKLGLALDCAIARARRVRAEELLLPGSARRGIRSHSTIYRLAINGKVLLPTAEGDRVIGIVRAHLEEDAAKTVHVGGALGPDRRRRLVARRLQPRRYAAGRDRDRARHPLGGRGEAVPPAPAPDDRRARDLRCGDGEGNAARRRQRLGASGRLGRAPHAHARSRT